MRQIADTGASEVENRLKRVIFPLEIQKRSVDIPARRKPVAQPESGGGRREGVPGKPEGNIMKKKLLIPITLLLLAAGAWHFRDGILTWFGPSERELVLYGNVDNRQLKLTFLISERIAELLPEEGSTVRKGDFLGSLETVRIQNDIASARADVSSRKASVEAARAACEKAKNGSRPEDIAVARAGNTAIEAKIRAAELDFLRQKTLRKTEAVSAQTEESAEAEFFFLKAALSAAQSYLAKLIAGERAEDIAAAAARLEQARAELTRAEAELAIREQRLEDAKLYAPADGVVRNRLLEPGELASPQNAVLTLAVTSPKWIRVYLPEPYLTLVRSGDRAVVRCDGAAADFSGWVGFLSPAAEFTPKNIETPELRTSLVYEMRVFVNDPENRLKPGAPATVEFPGVTVK